MLMNKTKIALLVSAAALSACATNIANYSPIEIASNSVRRTDALSGVSEVIAPRFKVTSRRRSDVRAQAQLRTAGPFTDDKNHVHEGGAYLDVSLKYSSATPHPAEARLYDQASWPGGQSALVADFGESVLDCREDIREYRHYTPIYGAWGYGHIHDDYCGHDHGGYGYYGHGHVHDDDCGHVVDDHGGGDGGTVVVRPTTDPRPITRPVTRPVRPGTIRPQPDGPGTEPGIGPYQPGSRVQPRASTRTSKRIVSRPRSDLGGGSTSRPAPAPKAVSRPVPTSKPTVSRPRPVSRPAPETRSKPSTSRPSVSRPSRRSTPRRSRVSSKVREMNYYPRDRYYDYGQTDYVVRRSCDRQENIRIFVPRARLDAAEMRGLLVYLRPRGGQEEVVSLPPNYISGFKMAAWSPEGQHMTMPERAKKSLQASQQSIPSKPVADPNKPIVYGEN